MGTLAGGIVCDFPLSFHLSAVSFFFCNVYVEKTPFIVEKNKNRVNIKQPTTKTETGARRSKSLGDAAIPLQGTQMVACHLADDGALA